MDVKKRLLELAEPEYREFHGKLLPGVEDILGVRVPALRKLAKEIISSDWRAFLEENAGETYEERQLLGLVTAGAWKKMDLEELLARTAAFVPKIDNWAVCDVFCGSYKAADGACSAAVWEFLQPYFQSEQEYELRFAVVMALSHYCDGEHADEAFRLFDGIRSEAYYVRMAVAWAVSVYFVKLPERTMEYLNKCELDDWTFNKALQKITESYRVDRETKDRIRRMKRK